MENGIVRRYPSLKTKCATRDARIVAVNGRLVVEIKDGEDAMGAERWMTADHGTTVIALSRLVNAAEANSFDPGEAVEILCAAFKAAIENN